MTKEKARELLKESFDEARFDEESSLNTELAEKVEAVEKAMDHEIAATAHA